MKMYFGPRFVINAKPKSNQQKETNMQKLESYEMPPVILADKTASELEVEKWYKNHQQVRNVVLEFAKQHPNGKVARLARSLDLNSYPETYPAPPCLLGIEEKK